MLRSAVPAAAADKELGQIYVKWNIKTLILGNQLVRLKGTQTGQCANCALACCSLLHSQLLLQTKSKQRPAALCLSASVWKKILLFKSHPEISDRLQPTQQPVQLLANSKPNRDSIAITSNSNWNQANLVCSRHSCHPNLLKILQTEFEKHVFLRKIAF